MVAGEEGRKKKLLEAALGVFLRYGFRKTSMDEVARAAQVSRQGLYLHFSTKEDLFRATLENALEDGLADVGAALGRADTPLSGRLVAAFDAWVGRYVGMLGTPAADLAEVSGSLGGDVVTRCDGRFLEAIAKALKADASLMGVYKAVGLTPKQLSETLYATARGLKHAATSRADFVQRFGVAARALCAPVAATRRTSAASKRVEP